MNLVEYIVFFMYFDTLHIQLTSTKYYYNSINSSESIYLIIFFTWATTIESDSSLEIEECLSIRMVASSGLSNPKPEENGVEDEEEKKVFGWIIVIENLKTKWFQK